MKIRKAAKTDIPELIKLYKATAKIGDGIARTPKEVTKKYIEEIFNSAKKNGLQFVAELNGQLISEIHCCKKEPLCFKHTLGEMTFVVHPDFHGQGVGKKIFSQLLLEIEKKHPTIARVELTVRQNNPVALKLYKSLGFKIEGIMKNRILDSKGNLSDDTMMAWFNPSYRA